MKLLARLLLVVASLLAASAAQAQSKAPATVAAPPAPTEVFVMQDGQVWLRKSSELLPLTKHVLLPNGIRINYQHNQLELPSGKHVTLLEGDNVTFFGEITRPLITPSSTAVAPPKSTAASPANAPATPVTATPPPQSQIPSE